MTTTHRDPVTGIWLLLMAATCATTWWLSKDAVSPVVGTVAIVLVAAFKVRLVLLHFMELRHAPLPWRCVFEGWTLLVTAALIALYLRA